MIKRTAFAALALASLASGAFAQTLQTPSAPTYTPDMRVNPTLPSSLTYETNAQALYWKQVMTDRAHLKATPADWRRAEQAANLINANQCGNAYKLAVIEMDEHLAKTVRAACTSRKHD